MAPSASQPLAGEGEAAKNRKSPPRHTQAREEKEIIMRKFIVLLAALAAMLLATASVGAQQTVFVNAITFAEQQSMDAGDPFVYTAIIVEDLANPALNRMIVVTDPTQSLNVEHPLGDQGTIIGVLLYSRTNTTLEEVLNAADEMITTRGGGMMFYAGNDVLPNDVNTNWVNAQNGFWITETRLYVKDVIDVPNGEWEDVEQLTLSGSEVVCPATASGCVYQAWDGVSANHVWNIAMEAGATFTEPKPLQGAFWVVNGVLETDMPALWARFYQMGEEERERDESAVEFVIDRVWVGTSNPPNSDWIVLSAFNFAATESSGTCTVTAKHADGVRIRSAKLVDAEVVTVLTQGATLSVTAVDDAGWITVSEGYIAPNAAVTLTGCESG